MAHTLAQRKEIWDEWREQGIIRGSFNGRARNPNYEKRKEKRMEIWRRAHPDYKEKIKLIHLRLKEEVLTHYGNGKLACVKCGFSNIWALTIDHMDGGGSQHRKGILRSTSSFYSWLKKNGYPDRFQTLCMNCQFIKRFERGEHN